MSAKRTRQALASEQAQEQVLKALQEHYTVDWAVDNDLFGANTEAKGSKMQLHAPLLRSLVKISPVLNKCTLIGAVKKFDVWAKGIFSRTPGTLEQQTFAERWLTGTEAKIRRY